MENFPLISRLTVGARMHSCDKYRYFSNVCKLAEKIKRGRVKNEDPVKRETYYTRRPLAARSGEGS